MGMDVGGSKKGAKGDINITPLIDVVLVLLIIFMVLTPTMLKHMTANVPRKDESQTQDVASAPIVLEVSAKSELSLNMEPVAAEALGDKVGERLKHDRQKVVFFKVDDDAPYGDVVKFMDIVKGAGAKTLGVITKD
ncbi:MAG TPA: biopolymer transporter ExbD [Polyangia bacterium]|nr:biopolymer transporter ExbD [Polyangia bacterium]